MDRKKYNINTNHGHFKDKEGEVWVTEEGYKITIISCRGYHDCDVLFENGYIKKGSSYNEIKKGKVKNVYHPKIFGVGFIGEGKYGITGCKETDKVYYIWYSMLKRCYDKSSDFPSYKNISVCEEWHNFQNYAKWFEENWKTWMDSTWHIDKDILCPDCRICSPSTCAFIPHILNSLFTKRVLDRGLPQGVYFKNNKYIAQMYINGKIKHIGSFDTVEKAKIAYEIVKEKKIKNLIFLYENKISKDVLIKLQQK